MSHSNVLKFAFSTNFCPISIDLSGNTGKNVAHFACNIEGDFFCDFSNTVTDNWNLKCLTAT